MKWEYKRLENYYISAVDLQLNSLGEDGWELCGMDKGGNFYFKRPKREWEAR